MTIMVLPWIMWINHYFTMDESIKTTRWTGGPDVVSDGVKFFL